MSLCYFYKKRKEKQFPLTIIFGMLHPRMITLYYENNNTFTQYNCLKIIDQTDFITLKCPRTFRMSNSTDIVRVLCKECGHTHAILLCTFVPYSQILLNDQITILQSDDEDKFLSDNPNFDLYDIKYIENSLIHTGNSVFFLILSL